MLTDGITKKVSVPHEENEWVEIKMLGWAALRQAGEENTRRVIANARNLGGELMASLKDAAAPQAEADPLAGYDLGVLLRAGVVAWSYKKEPTPSALDSLDIPTAEWLAREIVTYSTPASGDALKN